MTAIGINGFGRIGRNVLRAARGNAAFDVRLINDITTIETMAHLLKYDSNYGHYPGSVDIEDGHLIVDDRRMRVTPAPDPATLVVVNCAERTRSIIGAQSLINAGIANQVVALRTGTMGWELAGFAVERGQDRRPP